MVAVLNESKDQTSEYEKEMKEISEKIFTDKNMNQIIEVIDNTVPEDKRRDVAEKTLVEIFKANKKPNITKKYRIHHLNNDNEVIRVAETWVNGRYNHDSILEKYNPESNTWEEYQEEKPTLGHVKDQIQGSEWKIKQIAFDIETLAKMLNELADVGGLFNYDGAMFVHRILEDYSKTLHLETDKIENVLNHIS